MAASESYMRTLLVLTSSASHIRVLLQDTGLLDGPLGQENGELIDNYKPAYELQIALYKLKMGNFFVNLQEAQYYFDIVAKHQKPEEAAVTLRLLKSGGYLKKQPQAREYCDAVANYESPGDVYKLLCQLRKENLFADPATEYCAGVLLNHKYPHFVIELLLFLRNRDLFANPIAEAEQDDFNAIIALEFIQDVLNVLKWLDERGLLSGDGAQERVQAVFTHSSPNSLFQTLNKLGNTSNPRALSALFSHSLAEPIKASQNLERIESGAVREVTKNRF